MTSPSHRMDDRADPHPLARSKRRRSPPDRFVVVEDSSGPSGYTAIQPEVILDFHDLCLVLDDGEWWMGQLDTDGSVACWASYGPDLAEAIRGL